MLQRMCLVFFGCLFSFIATAQTAPVYSYKKLSSGLQYDFIINKQSSPAPKEGDEIKVNMLSVCNNRIMFSTSQQYKGKPAVYGVTKPGFKGDIIEVIMMMTPGDSIVCLADADAVFKGSKTKKPDFIKAGDKIQYFIKLVSIKPKEQVQKEQQAAFMKQMKEQQAKQKAEAAKQLIKDDKILKAYFIKKNITPLKTASGLYYVIKEEGTGETAIANDNITMNYTGTFLDGTKFDSNEDTAFMHVTPFQFTLGQGAVIKGWDEGVALLKKGSKATFYIPSPLAYGQQVRPGGGANPKGIPANSILVFDVQLLDATHPAPPPAPEVKADSLVVPQAPIIDSLITPAPKQ